MDNMLFEQKEIKLQNKWQFGENKRGYTACLKNAVHFLVV
jgi:hypothetical protein